MYHAIEPDTHAVRFIQQNVQKYVFFCLFWNFLTHFRAFKWKICLFYHKFFRKLYDRLNYDIHFHFNQLKSFQWKLGVKYDKRKKYVDVYEWPRMKERIDSQTNSLFHSRPSM